MVRADFVTSLVLILFGTWVVAEALRMPRFENLGVNPYTVPGIVPGVLGVTLGLFGLVMLARAWRQRAVGARASAAPGAHAWRLLLTITATVGYGGLLVGWLPFPLATFLFVTGFIVLFEMREPQRRPAWRIAALALLEGVLVAAAVTYVFERIFLVRLP